MEAPRSVLKRGQRRRKTVWGVGAAIVLVILIVIIVPCAVLLPEDNNGGQPSTAFVPLYIYPDGDAWDPVFRSITSNPDLPFAVIVNPESGPGSSDSPGDDYVRAIERMNSYSNVETFGYVRTNYTLRPIDDVLADIQTYAGWADINSTLAVSGIFFDEAPHEYSADAHDFLQTVKQAAKDASGINEPRTVIYNPGVIPDPRLVDGVEADITVVFEQSFEELKDQKSSLNDLSEDRSNYAYVVHSVPGSKNLGKLLARWSKRAEYLFVTTLDDRYYERFGPNWGRFIAGVPT